MPTTRRCMEGRVAQRFFADADGRYRCARGADALSSMKVETHNHPTAISPFPGAATGSGGEIRDEGATGRGAKPKAGLTGFTRVEPAHPGVRPAVGARRRANPTASPPRSTSCSRDRSAPRRSTTSSGVPNLAGYFRTFEQPAGGDVRGYHKPIMIAGGVGNVVRRMRDEERDSRRRAAGPARRPRHADRPGRRRGLVAWTPARTSRTSTSIRCSAATPRSSAARRK